MTGSLQVMYAECALGCAAVAAVTDWRQRRIPNWLTGPAFVAGLGLHLVCAGWAQAGLALAAGLLSGAVFLVFYLAGGMGAGDVKLMTAIGALGGMALVRAELLTTVCAGAVFAVVYAVMRGRLRTTLSNVKTLVEHHQARGLVAHDELNVCNAATLRLPYALPIACGCLATFCMQMYEGVA